MNNRLLSRYRNADKRSREYIKNTILSLVMKGANILASLLIVPMTINYLNPSQYGIWLTISSVIGWILFFDLGLGNGFRNKFTTAKANGDIILAREYVSTTYFALSCIVSVVYVVVYILNNFLDWSSILNVPESYKIELQQIFVIISGFTCLSMVANLFTTLLSADQKPGFASLIQGVGQYISLFAIFLLTKYTEGSMLNLAMYYSGIPCCVMILSSVVAYSFSKYRCVAPSFKYAKVRLVKSILSLGSQFFLIYLCLIAIFQVINIVISREIGPLGVTQYTIANKYFGIIYMIMLIIINPLWSAFTDAYAKCDYVWMRRMVCKMERTLMLCIGIGIVMLLCSSLFYKFWVGNSVSIPLSLSCGMLFFVIMQTFGNIYMYMLNGIGAVRIQLIIYVSFALISWPLFLISSRAFGLLGIVLIPSIVYMFQGIIGRIQLNKLINGTAKGLWRK